MARSHHARRPERVDSSERGGVAAIVERPARRLGLSAGGRLRARRRRPGSPRRAVETPPRRHGSTPPRSPAWTETVAAAALRCGRSPSRPGWRRRWLADTERSPVDRLSAGPRPPPLFDKAQRTVEALRAAAAAVRRADAGRGECRLGLRRSQGGEGPWPS